MKRAALAPIRVAKPSAAPRHAEVALRYAWHETHGRVYAPHRLVVVNRARELRLFLSYRHGDVLPEPLLMLVQIPPCRDGCRFGLLDGRSGGRQFLIGQIDQIHKLDRVSEVTLSGSFDK